MYFISALCLASCLKNEVYTHSVLLVWRMNSVFGCDIEMHGLMSFYKCVILVFEV